MTVTVQDLPDILASHRKWLRDEGGGKRADLHKANLSRAYLSGANLSRAYLSEADLHMADLSRADLSGANLRRACLIGAGLSGANLSGADLRGADLSGADLSEADLYGANLYGANLSEADLHMADLSRADLSGANLRRACLIGAGLSRANLRRANLSGARGISPELCTPLLMLLDQPGAIRAYKLVNRDGYGPFNGGLQYVIGEPVEVSDACTNRTEQCAAGINVATLDWCLHEWRPGHRILIVEFTAADIAAIPTATDGKFRLHRCHVVGEKAIDPAALHLVKEAAEK